MKTILIIPILFIVFGVSEQHAAAVEDCDDEELVSKDVKHPLPHRILQKLAKPTRIQMFQTKKQNVQSARKQIKEMAKKLTAPTPSPTSARPINRRQHRPKPVNLVIKPIPNELPTKRKLSDLYPNYQIKKQKRIKLIPTYEEYEAYPDNDYGQKVLYPETRGFEYMDVDNNANYGVPCDHDISPETNMDINVREMGVSTEQYPEESTIEIAEEQQTQTDREIKETTSAPETAVEFQPRSLTINNHHPALSNLIEMLMQGMLAFMSCIKAKAPMFEDLVSKIFKTAFNSCNKPIVP